MSWSAIRLGIIVLEFIGIVLLSALLATPAPKHAIVNTLTVASLLRSIFAVIPPLAYERFSDDFDHLFTHPALGKFCVVIAIALRYLTVVKAAFTVSFTLPLLYLAIQHSRMSVAAASRRPPFFSRTILVLCIGPFIWALPAIIIPLPTAIHDHRALKPMFFEAICSISNTPYQIVSLSLMIVPLLFASAISIPFVWYLRKFVKLPLASHSLGRFDLARILRFGALLVVIVLSAILYIVVMATWAKDHINPRMRVIPMHTVFVISMIWEGMTPIIMFFIFGAQEEVFTVWASWYHWFWSGSSHMSALPRITGNEKSMHPDRDSSFLDISEPNRRPLHVIHRLFPMNSAGIHSSHVEYSDSGDGMLTHSKSDLSASKVTEIPKVERFVQSMPPLPKRILQKHPSSCQPLPRALSQSNPDLIGLRPPPRPRKSAEGALTLDDIPSRQPLMQIPSLTAFGSRHSLDQTLFIDGDGAEDSGEDSELGDEVHNLQALPVHNGSARPTTGESSKRPTTGESSRTFGRPY